ncbi:MAG TPA: hypothetical protein VGN26_05010 [Armatimonadota bacterium]|jgi:hypothetical protein
MVKPVVVAICVMASVGTAPVGAEGRLTKEPHLVTVGTETAMVLPPEMVAAPMVTQVEVSPDQQYVLVLRTGIRPLLRFMKQGAEPAPKAEAQLLLYDVRRGETEELWRPDPPTGGWQETTWLTGSKALLVLLAGDARGEKGQSARRTTTLVWGSPDSQPVVTRLPLPASGELSWGLHPCPNRPLALLTGLPAPRTGKGTPTPPSVLFLVDAQGHVGKGLSLPEGYGLLEVHWSVDGSPVLRLTAPGKEGREPAPLWATPDMGLQQLRTLEAPPTLAEPPADAQPKPQDGALSGLSLKQGTVTATEAGTTETLTTVWVESTTRGDHPRALVCSDCEEARLLPGPVVLYQALGALWVSALAKPSAVRAKGGS